MKNDFYSLGSDDYIIWYRPETMSEINWEGDPKKAIVKDSNGLHPRNSFNIWKQIIKNQSSLWKEYEINGALQYDYVLHNQLIMIIYVKKKRNTGLRVRY